MKKLDEEEPDSWPPESFFCLAVPSPSDSSSDSPPRLTGMEDDILSETPETFQNYGKLESSMANLKRHFSGHPIAIGGPERAREPKSRRKESRAGGHGGGPGGLWEQGSSQVRVRDELVDSGLVVQLRNRE